MWRREPSPGGRPKRVPASVAEKGSRTEVWANKRGEPIACHRLRAEGRARRRGLAMIRRRREDDFPAVLLRRLTMPMLILPAQ